MIVKTFEDSLVFVKSYLYISLNKLQQIKSNFVSYIFIWMKISIWILLALWILYCGLYVFSKSIKGRSYIDNEKRNIKETSPSTSISKLQRFQTLLHI
jgi:hypothetical protein